jgi:hypothetical protein
MMMIAASALLARVSSSSSTLLALCSIIAQFLVEPLVVPAWVLLCLTASCVILGKRCLVLGNCLLRRREEEEEGKKDARKEGRENENEKLKTKREKEALVDELAERVDSIEEALSPVKLEAKMREILLQSSKKVVEKEDVEMMDSSPSESKDSIREANNGTKKRTTAASATSPVEKPATPSPSGNGTEDMSWAQTNDEDGAWDEEITSPRGDNFTRVKTKSKKKEEAKLRKMKEEEESEAERRNEEAKREREKKKREEEERKKNRVEDLKRKNERLEKERLENERMRVMTDELLSALGASKPAKTGDLYTFLTLTMEEEAFQIGNDVRSIEKYYKKAQIKFHPDKSHTTREQKVFNEEVFKLLQLCYAEWVGKGKPLGERQPQQRPETPKEAKFSSEENFQGTEGTWSRARSGTRRKSSPSSTKNGWSTSNASSGFHHNPFSNAQQQNYQRERAAKKPTFFSAKKKSSDNSQPSSPSSPSTRL